jgi:hypothetical protein
MPDLYQPIRRAGASYAGMFLRMLGAHDDAGAPAAGQHVNHPNGGRSAAATPRRGEGRRPRPRRGT